jgi:hypothetical protein
MAGKVYTDDDITPDPKPKVYTDHDINADGLADSVLTVQEQHPDISEAERVILKNTANSPQAMVRTLQKWHPGADVKFDKDQILYKKPDEEQYRVLDPQAKTSWLHPIDRITEMLQDPKEVGKDILDVPVDAAQGVITNAAGAAMAAPATIATLPEGGVGAIPAYMMGAGLTGSGTEYLKQRLGKMLGVEQEVDPKQVAMTGVMSAILPNVTGTGVAANQLANSAVKRGVANTAEQFLKSEAGQVAQNAQRGGMQLGWDYAKGTLLPQAGQMISGVSARAIKGLSKHLPEIEEMEKSGQVGPVVRETMDDFRDKLQRKLAEQGRAIPERLNQTGQQVDLGAAKQHLKDLHQDYMDQYNRTGNETFLKNAEQVNNVYNEIFQDGRTARPASSLLDAEGKPLVAAQEAQELPNKIPARSAWDLQTGPIRQNAEYHKMHPLMPVPDGKPIPDARLAGAVGKTDGAINQELELATAGADSTGKLKGDYRATKELERGVAPYFRTDQQAFNTLRNLDSPSKRLLYESLDQADKQLGTDLLPTAEKLEAYSAFSKPSWDAVSSGGSTSTSRTLPLYNTLASGADSAAEHIGVPFAKPALKGLAYVGTKLGSPKAIRAMVSANAKLSPVLKKWVGTPAGQAELPLYFLLNSKFNQENEQDEK